MTYTLHIYKLNLTTNEYELEDTITCDDSLKAHEQLVYMYIDRDSKPLFRKYEFSYEYGRVNITCKFLHPTDYINGDPCNYKYLYKNEYEFINPYYY